MMDNISLKNDSLLKTRAYINGEWVSTKSEFQVYNPFNGNLLSNISDCNREDTKKAINAANDAFHIWRSYSASKRSRILKNWCQLQLENVRDLAKILTLEQGKPIYESIGEIRYGASFVEWFSEEARRIYGDVIPGHSADKRITVIKQPVGVVGAITPWNFPSAMITRKVAPALAAGCTVVIKPSELTPLSALALAQLAEEAGFPKGVLNIVTAKDPKPIGEELTTNPTVKKISFTGSTKVGKILLKQAADQVKKVTLELGGNAPFIVFDDANIEAAVEGCIASKFRNAGQTCICTNRIFLHHSIYEEFIDKLIPKIKELNSGNGLDRGIQIGPMINEEAIQKSEQLIQDALEKGAEIKLGGSRNGNRFFEPTLVENLTPQMDIFQEEIFGPVAAVYAFDSEDEVIHLANQTSYGLASYFYAKDYAKIWRVSEALQFGMVGINTGMISTTLAPFGGVKESGFGREGSKYGIDDYVNIKYLCWGGI